MKKSVAAILAIIMLFSLTACGKKTAEEAGSYTLYEMTTPDGETYDHELLALTGMDVTLVLKEDGTGTMNIDGEISAITWKSGTITEADTGLTYTYSYQNGKLTLEDASSGYTMVFQKTDEVTSDGAEAQANQTPYQEYWNGDWYGWLLVKNGSGAYEEWIGYYWDCMARISIDEKGEGTLILWDEASAVDNPTVELDVAVSDGGYEQGRLKSVSGFFWDAEIGNADWLVDPEPTNYEHLIIIEGSYTDPEDFFSDFSYEIYMKPWGLDWADVEAELPSELPVHYDWYLSAISSGMQMPDVIGGGDTLAEGEVPDDQMESQGSAGELTPPGGEYGHSVESATGVVSHATLQELCDWLRDAYFYDKNPSYQEIYEHVGNVHGQFWFFSEPSYVYYRWYDEDGLYVQAGYEIQADGTEVMIGPEYSSALSN